MTRPAERVSKFYNGRGTAEQWITEGKYALRWTRLSCHSFRHNAVRLQLHALAYNLANFLRSMALPKEVEQWSLTTLREKLVKIGARIVRHGRYVVFQLAEVAVPGYCSPRSCAGSAGCVGHPCRRHDGRQPDDGCGRRESHAPEPGRTSRNQMPGRVEASPVALDGQDRGLRHPAC